MSILDKVNSNIDLKKLSFDEMRLLSDEIREFIIENVSHTGGHLASNLGSVELTLALNRVYDAEKDRIVFDVGHQSYTHKIINGRKDSFHTLRTLNGISGFPKPYESDADAFVTGHSSTSVSVALGMAEARTLRGENYDVCAVIGDGALTGGLAYEGLENVASSNEPMVIILNDNAMSINSNVGGMNRLLQKLRVKPDYFKFKRKFRSYIGINTDFYTFTHKTKEYLKSHLMENNMFYAMGLDYLGPVDGHDVEALETIIRWARDMRKPVLLHVITVKGKGCRYAAEQPDKYHGVGPFNPKTGELSSSNVGFGDVMGRRLTEMAGEDRNIVAITAAMASGTGLDVFKNRHADRFFDVGIAEQHAVAMAAGMAKQGLLPVFAVYSSFLQRAYDMLQHDVALQNLHTVFCVDRAGLVGRDGETHNGVFDVSYLKDIPGMTVFAPSSFKELSAMLKTALYDCAGPVAIRYPRGGEGAYRDDSSGDETRIAEGSKITVVSYGILINNVIEASKGKDVDIIKINKLHPCDFKLTLESVRKTGKLVVVEDVCEEGCIGSDILKKCAETGISGIKSRLLNLGDGIVPHGSVAEQQEMNSLDTGSIAAIIDTI